VLTVYRGVVTESSDGSAALESLTSREVDVLRGIGQGASNQEIAAALYVSEATVKSHVGHIFAKLGLRDRAAAIVFAFDHRLVTPS
jgi:DNA-binding NarL/FixJ family response regulator